MVSVPCRECAPAGSDNYQKLVVIEFKLAGAGLLV